jgi:transposase
MQKKNTTLNFTGQTFFIGLDVHKKSWNVAIRSNGLLLKIFSINPDANELWKYLTKNYPKGEYRSVYEAGFSGFRAHRELLQKGIHNIVVNAADIPTSSKEKMMKTDPSDSAKLARELASDNLKGIYIPDELSQELRSFCRLRYQMMQNQTRVKNRIKSYLAYYGHNLPENHQLVHWSGRFIDHLKTLEFISPLGKDQLEIYIAELLEIRSRLLLILKTIRKYIREYKRQDELELLLSIPGFGYTTAITFLTELIDIDRFSRFDQLAGFVGLVPSTRSSGEKDKTIGLSNRFNKYLRTMLIEAAWIAVRKDPALILSFSQLTKRMSKQEAIIRIAKKLLSRMDHVWRHRTKYVFSVVE